MSLVLFLLKVKRQDLPLVFSFGSSALIEAFLLLYTVFSPCRRLYFFLSEEKVSKKTDLRFVF